MDGRAELIWKLGSADEDRDNFHVGGVWLEHIDVFDANTGRWGPWHGSAATIADSARLAACGWSPIAIDTRQGGAGIAYWHVIPEFAHRPMDCRYWYQHQQLTFSIGEDYLFVHDGPDDYEDGDWC